MPTHSYCDWSTVIEIRRNERLFRYGLDVDAPNVVQRLNSGQIFADFYARYGRRHTEKVTEEAEKRLSPKSALENAAIATIQIGCISGLNATVYVSKTTRLPEEVRFLLESPMIVKVRARFGCKIGVSSAKSGFLSGVLRGQNGSGAAEKAV